MGWNIWRQRPGCCNVCMVRRRHRLPGQQDQEKRLRGAGTVKDKMFIV
jgi:hypothetical protein